MSVQQLIEAKTLRENGSLSINTLDSKGKVVAVTRFSLLHIGESGRDVIEIRTETTNGNTEQRVEVNNHTLGQQERPMRNILDFYRRVMDHIHEGGNIYYDAGRMQAYSIIAKLASEERLNG